MLLAMTGIALEDLCSIGIGQHYTLGAFGVSSSISRMPQILWHEVTLRPSLLLLVCGASRTGTSVQHCLVYGMTPSGCLFPGAHFAADVT